MPATLRLLRWLYLGRLAVAGGIFASAWAVWRAAALEPLLAGLLLLLAVAVTAASAWHTHLRRRAPGSLFLYAQLVFDALLVTGIVFMTGGWASDFAPLYILVIAAAALLLPWPGGVFIGALSALLYIGSIVWTEATPPASVYIQLALFGAVAVVTAYLGDRLRRAGTELDAVASELKRLRLDTDDLLGALETGIATVDGEGRLVYLNPAGERLLRLRRREFLDRPVLEELRRRAPGIADAIERTVKRGAPVRRAEARARFGETEVILGVRTTLLERGRPRAGAPADDAPATGSPWITAVFQDITDGKRVEELNRRTERLEAVAELAASLAHEIKNPLASIRSAVEQLVGSRLKPGDREVLEALVQKESDRLSRLLADFIDFSRVELTRSETVDLTRIVHEAVAVARQHPDAGAGPEIAFELPPRPVMVDGDQDLLHRAVFNLLLNAVQHTGADGRVRVELGVADELALPAGIALGKSARLDVVDTGDGIPPEERARIFDPFYTTRREGTGLGLALVHRTVKAHRGSILVQDANPGTRFTIYLPLHVEAATPTPAGGG